MDWIRSVATVCVASVAVAALGALITLTTAGLLAGQYVVPAVLAVVIVAVSVAGMVWFGAQSSRLLANPYW